MQIKQHPLRYQNPLLFFAAFFWPDLVGVSSVVRCVAGEPTHPKLGGLAGGVVQSKRGGPRHVVWVEDVSFLMRLA